MERLDLPISRAVINGKRYAILGEYIYTPYREVVEKALAGEDMIEIITVDDAFLRVCPLDEYGLPTEEEIEIPVEIEFYFYRTKSDVKLGNYFICSRDPRYDITEIW